MVLLVCIKKMITLHVQNHYIIQMILLLQHQIIFIIVKFILLKMNWYNVQCVKMDLYLFSQQDFVLLKFLYKIVRLQKLILFVKNVKIILFWLILLVKCLLLIIVRFIYIKKMLMNKFVMNVEKDII